MTHHIEELKKLAISKLNLNSIGIIIFLLFLLIAIAAGIISPYNPWQRFEPYTRPNSSHFLGTNDMGNDILSELLFGARVSLIVGFGASIIATILGVTYGHYRHILNDPKNTAYNNPCSINEAKLLVNNVTNRIFVVAYNGKSCKIFNYANKRYLFYFECKIFRF
jgi:ABC-type antimicrobial peptide transport system permease subunit